MTAASQRSVMTKGRDKKGRFSKTSEVERKDFLFYHREPKKICFEIEPKSTVQPRVSLENVW
jgi:hypothetical protein